MATDVSMKSGNHALDDSHGSISDVLGRFAAESEFESLEPNIKSKLKSLLLYSLAVGVASTESSLPRDFVTVAKRNVASGSAAASCLLDGTSTDPDWAAFANAALFHIRMQEDAHPAGHVGVAIIPAAMAIAQAEGASGTTLLAAICSGYEVALRVGRDHARSLSGRGFRTTPIYGAIGAAAAVARVMGLSSAQTAHAIGLAANMGAGLRAFQEAGTEEYALHAGLSARNGITAAQLAAKGIKAAPRTFEGTAGFFAAFGDDAEKTARRVSEQLGSEYEFETVTFKPQPGGQFHRGIVKGITTLRQRAEQHTPKEIRVYLSPFVFDFPGLSTKAPFSSYSNAFYSIPYCVALSWVDGAVTFAGLHRFSDDRILSVSDCVVLMKDSERGNYDPYIEVELDNGDVISWKDTEGENAYVLDWDSAVSMTRKLCDEVGVPNDRIEKLIETVNGAEGLNANEIVHAAVEATMRG